VNPIRLLPALAAAAVVAATAAAPAGAKTTITMSGSTSVYPLAVALAKQYVSLHRGQVGFRILQGGSDIGINDVAHGRVTIGNASRDPVPGSDPSGLTFTKIARDGVCVITNKSNPISNLSQQQVQAIFSGQVRNWSDVPGAKATGPIDLITRTAASGTGDAFQNIFMSQNLRVAASAEAKSSNGLVNQAVRSDKNAVGFVSFDFITGANPVGYQGVPCTLRNAKSGQYGGVRNFWMVTRGAPTGATKAFLKWVHGDSKARSIISTHWIALG
jgi:phosphate transport system substrate-binding protein